MTTISLSSAEPFLAAGFPAYPDVGDNTYFILVGFGFVLFVLAVLAAVTSLIGVGITRANRSAEQKPSAQPAAPPPPPTSTDANLFEGHENPEHVPALIAAAVHAMLRGRKHRIKGVRVESGRWAQEGRRDIFSSHRLR